MIKNGFFVVIAFFFILFVSIFAGCTQSHTEEFNNVNTLIESGASRIDPLISANFSTADLAMLRVNTDEANGNFSEAINILNNIPSKELSDIDQTNLKATKTLIDANIKISELLRSNLWYVSQKYQYEMNDPTMIYNSYFESDQIKSDLKSNLLIIKSKISDIDRSIYENFSKFNYSEISPNTLKIYNETGSRLIKFNKNIDKSVTFIEKTCLRRCLTGQVLGTDCNCHTECGIGKYCKNGFECCGDQCYNPAFSGCCHTIGGDKLYNKGNYYCSKLWIP